MESKGCHHKWPAVQRHKYKGKFEFTYVSKSAVIVKELKTGKRIVLKSVYGYEIERINIYKVCWDGYAGPCRVSTANMLWMIFNDRWRQGW